MTITARRQKEGDILYTEPTKLVDRILYGTTGIPRGTEVIFADGNLHYVAAAPPGKPPEYNKKSGFAKGVIVRGIGGLSDKNFIEDNHYRPGAQVAPREGIIFEVT